MAEKQEIDFLTLKSVNLYNTIMIFWGFISKNPKLYFHSFFFPFAYRVFSGVQNSFGYADNFVGSGVMTFVMLLLAFAPLFFFKIKKRWHFFSALSVAFITGISAFLIHYSFIRPEQWISDIHLWETISTGVYTLWWLIEACPIAVLFSVYPSLFIHKVAINIGSGLPAFASLKSFELLGWNIPSGSMIYRAVMGVLSLAGFVFLGSYEKK